MPVSPLLRLFAAVAGIVLLVPVAAVAQDVDPEGAGDLPVLSAELARGAQTTSSSAGQVVPKTTDGDISDWTGEISRYGGTFVYSNGELVYQDHLFDAHGPDDGRDARRLARTDPVEKAVPETYRLDALAQADAPGEFGAPTPAEFSYDDTYGDAAPHQDAADLEEVRVAVDGESVHLLARTTTLVDPASTGLLILADTVGGAESTDVPFNAGIHSSVADVAVFISDRSVLAADLSTGAVTPIADAVVAVNLAGYTNAFEVRLPTSLLQAEGGELSLAVASGPASTDGTSFANLPLDIGGTEPHANLANVAFRTDEPARVWFEKAQALALHAGSIDDFFIDIDVAKLSSGVDETLHPGPGYHDRIFISSEAVARERGRDGVFQHYGVFLPQSYTEGEGSPLQWWLHWRGGNAHTAASIIPRMYKHFGEYQDTIVVSPSGRGTGRWYVGKGHVDFLEVWGDVFSTFAIERERVYVTGHSMGGWGSYLMTVLYPDRFAGAAPYAGPVTQGAWTGLDFPGCDNFNSGGNTPCYISANGGRPRDQHTRKLLENLRHVPVAIMHGTSDELVPYSGVARQAERMFQLNYRFRFYTYPGYEHYSHPIMDQWTEAARYLHKFTRPENPREVTYHRDMPFELATEEVQSDGVPLSFDFDSAYWLSELTPTDMQKGVATFNGKSLAIAEQPYLVAPDVAGPTTTGTTGPYVGKGWQWVPRPGASAEAPSNAFEATLTGASNVRLDLARMNIDTGEEIRGTIGSNGTLDLRLDGGWSVAPEVTVNDAVVNATLEAGVLTVPLVAGTSNIVISPTTEPTESPTTTPTESPTESPSGSPSESPTPAKDVTAVEFTANSDAGGRYSDDATVEAVLTNESTDAPIEGAELSFEMTGDDGTETWTETTGTDGVASREITLDRDAGSYQLVVRYEGNEHREASANSMPFVIDKEVTKLTLEKKGTKKDPVLVATLTDDEGDPLAGREIEFRADGAVLGSATTDEDGVARMPLPNRYNKNKTTFEATFAGDANYESASA